MLTFQRLATRPYSPLCRQFSVRKHIQTTSTLENVPDDAVPVYFVAKEDESPPLTFSASTAALSDFSRKLGELKMVYGDQDRALLVGLGKKEKMDEHALRKATFAAMTAVQHAKNTTALLHVPAIESLSTHRTLELMSQVSMLSNYKFDKYLTKKDNQPPQLENVYLLTNDQDASAVEEQKIVAEETLRARDLGNDRSDVVNPAYMEEMAQQAVNEIPGLSMKVLQEQELKDLGLNMMAAVGGAATCPPRLILLEYNGASSSDETIALVGKGVTFDTGGLNLKPTGFIEDMHMDMCGSAAVLCAIRAAARLGLKKNIVAALAMAENSIDAKAMKPHAIIKSYKGTFVEVNNTDAEGRLVLGDAISYVQEKYKPNTVIDVATLTGACVVALGEYAAGVFSNDDKLASGIEKAGQKTFERCWRLPVFSEHKEELKGAFSDSRSTGKGRSGGASTAAAFLEQFINEGVSWAHVDVAGPAMYSTKRSYMPQGATGFGVNLLYEFLKNKSVLAKEEH